MLGDGAGNDDSDSDSGLSGPRWLIVSHHLLALLYGAIATRGGGPRNLRNLRRMWLVEAGALLDIPDRAPPYCSSCKNLGHYASNCARPHT